MALTLHRLEEVAERFRVSRRTMQEVVRAHPYYRVIGRRKLFTEADIARLYEALPCPSNSSSANPVFGTFAAPSEASLLTKAHALLNAKPLKRSERAGSGRSRKAQCSGVVLPLRSSKLP